MNQVDRPNRHRSPRARSAAGLAVALALVLVSCATPAGPNGPPAPPAISCVEVAEGAPGPTLVCTVADGAVTLRVPWQGQPLVVASLRVDDLGWLSTTAAFRPLAQRPVARLELRTQAGVPVRAFDPPLRLEVAYGASEFGQAQPFVNEGELGLAVWNEATQAWIVLGHGVFHAGFWLADPIAGGGMELATDVANGQPRFQLSGGPAGGRATVLIRASLSTLPLMWGAMPFDPDHMLKEFDGCMEVEVDVGTAVECVAAMVGVTVRVPYQEDGTVVPRVIALPWNKASTFEGADVAPSGATGPASNGAGVVERLMNFLVVDDADPGRVLTEFNPPMEFEIAYPEAYKDPDVNPLLVMKYWDEYVERWVWLGSGDTGACTLTYGSGSSPNCVWGTPNAASAIAAPPFNGQGFFLTNEDGQGGVARFTYDIWGDRLVAWAR